MERTGLIREFRKSPIKAFLKEMFFWVKWQTETWQRNSEIFKIHFSNTIWELCYAQFSTIIYQKRSLAASYLFRMLARSVQFNTFHCYILKSADVWKRWSIKKTKKNELLLPSTNVTVKFELAFVFSQENGLSYRFHFKPKRKSISSSKK